MRAERVHSHPVNVVTCGVPGNTLAADAHTCGDAEKRVCALCELRGANDAVCTQETVASAAEEPPGERLRKEGLHELNSF